MESSNWSHSKEGGKRAAKVRSRVLTWEQGFNIFNEISL